MMRKIVGCVLVLALVTFAGVGLAASSYSDGAGDNNAAPDITSVTVSESPEGVLTVVVGLGNYQALSGTSLLDLWFDLDNNQQTGDEGDEALVEYSANGILDLYRWNGRDMVRRPATGMAAAFAAGTLTFTGPKTAFDNATSFGVLVVAQRRQKIFDDEFTAADWAPDIGRSPYVAPGPLSFSDPAGDMDAASKLTTFPIVIALKSQPPGGWVNVPAQADIVLGANIDAIAVPERCVRTDPSGRTYVTLRTGASLRRRYVEVGAIQKDRIQIRSGLEKGQVVMCRAQ